MNYINDLIPGKKYRFDVYHHNTRRNEMVFGIFKEYYFSSDNQPFYLFCQDGEGDLLFGASAKSVGRIVGPFDE